MNERDIARICEAEGVTLVSVTRGKHWRARIRASDGRERNLNFPCSPSDVRAERNKRRDLRAFAKGVQA
jgi:hypothetical protein